MNERTMRCDAKDWVIREDSALARAKARRDAIEKAKDDLWKDPNAVRNAIASTAEPGGTERADDRATLVEFADDLDDAKARARKLAEAHGSR